MPRKCKHCKAVELLPASKTKDIIEKKGYCSVKCLAEHTKEKRIKAQAKAEAKELKAAKERVKTRRQWMKEAQQWFNKFIRLRDHNDPCISCGRHHEGQYHAGHYRTTGAAGHLRFDENNCHKQCAPCNNHLSGNIANYRPNLLAKVGEDELERIETDNTSYYWRIEDLKQIKEKYKAKCKKLEKELNRNLI